MMTVSRARVAFLAALIIASGISSYGEPFDRNADSGAVSGYVLDAGDAPVVHAAVVLRDQASGVPVVNDTWRPFTENFDGEDDLKEIAHTFTDEKGHFEFRDVLAGLYNVTAQTWDDTTYPVSGILDANSKRVTVRGRADMIVVPSRAATDISIKPLGRGSAHLDLKVGNDDAYVLVSTSPPEADPILMFWSWGQGFIRNVVGCARMIKGDVILDGLPDGTLYFCVFANDNSPGFGSASATIRSGQTAEIPMEIVARWSDARHEPPEHLKPYVQNAMTGELSSEALLAALGADALTQQPRHYGELLKAIGPIDRKVALPSGERLTVGEIVAVLAYADLQRGLKKQVETQQANQAPVETQ